MKYEVFDWRVEKIDKIAKGKLTYQRIKTVELTKLDKLNLKWFNYENYGKKFYCYNKGFNRLYTHTYTHYIKRNWIEPMLKDGNLFKDKEVKRKVLKNENQISMF